MNSEAQLGRLGAANELIECIASCGRHFFKHEGKISRLEIDPRGRIWLIDKYTQKRIYTHYSGRWRGFTEGGTLRDLIKALRNFVKDGTQIRRAFGPWPEWMCDGDLWGYGENMETVRDRARELRISEDPS